MSDTYENIDLNGNLRGLVTLKGFYIQGVDYPEMNQLTVKEIVMGESLLTPGLQTAITFQNSIYLPPGKNFDKFKNKGIWFTLERNYKDLQGRDINFTMTVAGNRHTVYRMDSRHFKPTNVSETEEFTVHACDQSLLDDAKTLVSKSWRCVTPIDIVKHALQCGGVPPDQLDYDETKPNRDYIAENIHPFQVINQQANVALYDDHPDFVHFMTYNWRLGDDTKHHFRSLRSLCKELPGEYATYYYSDSGLGQQQPSPDSAVGSYGTVQSVISMEFPCDFDILSDILNGIDENGQEQNTLATFNPVQFLFNSSSQTSGCGIGQFNYKIALSNKNTTKQQDSCNMDVEKHVLERQARMALLERDKIALRMVVPFNPTLNAGKTVRLLWPNKYESGTPTYGEGVYLITSLTHTYKLGGFSTTTIDCVTNTAGVGLTGRA